MTPKNRRLHHPALYEEDREKEEDSEAHPTGKQHDVCNPICGDVRPASVMFAKRNASNSYDCSEEDNC